LDYLNGLFNWIERLLIGKADNRLFMQLGSEETIASKNF